MHCADQKSFSVIFPVVKRSVSGNSLNIFVVLLSWCTACNIDQVHRHYWWIPALMASPLRQVHAVIVRDQQYIEHSLNKFFIIWNWHMCKQASGTPQTQMYTATFIKKRNKRIFQIFQLLLHDGDVWEYRPGRIYNAGPLSTPYTSEGKYHWIRHANLCRWLAESMPTIAWHVMSYCSTLDCISMHVWSLCVISSALAILL